MGCCMGEENTGGSQDQWRSPVREKPALTSSPPPQKGRLSATSTQGERGWFLGFAGDTGALQDL